MFERESSASTAAESSRPRTASQSSGVNRPSTEVRTQKVLGLGRERRQNLIRQVVRDVSSAADERPHTLIGVLEVTQPQRREPYSPAGHPSVRSTSNSTLSSDSSIPSRRISSRVSSTVKASSRARISTSAPRARRRARLIAGSERVDASTARVGRQPFDRVCDRSKRTSRSPPRAGHQERSMSGRP